MKLLTNVAKNVGSFRSQSDRPDLIVFNYFMLYHFITGMSVLAVYMPETHRTEHHPVLLLAQETTLLFG